MSKQRSAPGDLERVRQFVNTRQIGHVSDRIGDPGALAAWLEEQALAEPGLRATPADLAHAVELREALRAMLVAHNGRADAPVGATADAPVGATALADAPDGDTPDAPDGDTPDATARATHTLDEAAARARLRLRFAKNGTASLVPEAGGVDGALGTLLAIVNDAIAQGTWIRLKACREHDCEWAFYDHTKNRSGAWCSMSVCGNRAKARAYRERHATPSSQPS